MRILLLTTFLALLSACATNHVTQTAENWRGQSADALVKSWGTPNLTATAADGNKTYVYTTQSIPSTMSYGTPTVVNAGGLPIVVASPPVQSVVNDQSVKCTFTFEVNKAGIVVNTVVHGNNCMAPSRV